jgi:hypothetical protein
LKGGEKSFEVFVETVPTDWGGVVARNNESKTIARFRAWRAGAKLEWHISSWSGFIVRIPKLEAQSCGQFFSDRISERRR